MSNVALLIAAVFTMVLLPCVAANVFVSLRRPARRPLESRATVSRIRAPRNSPSRTMLAARMA